ncbi:hypothetical protein Sango_1241800 [Sesamum angolense]|uniref:RNase H type-1 domain-containing protein n=1 Tax=Sesamum angolense TaxID=2727404 RepID=A0AAE1WR40_9LAMI|nr:hypothetical protein Sango_1241800 [Sesamum angolense]
MEDDKGNWLLHGDGSSTLTGSGARVVLTSSEGNKVEYAFCFDFKASNHEAEYDVITVPIRMPSHAGAKNLIAYTDSQLVTNKVERKYEVKEERMKEYLQEIEEFTSQLKNFQLYQIPRTEHTKADYLAQLASSL